MSSTNETPFEKYELLKTSAVNVRNDNPILYKDSKQRTHSQLNHFIATSDPVGGQDALSRRRLSADTVDQQSRSLLIPVDETLEQLLATEDIDKNFQITIEDTGPKV